MADSRKFEGVEDLRRAIQDGELTYPPAELRLAEGRTDVVLEVAWRGVRTCFAFVYRNKTGPKSLQEAAMAARRVGELEKLPPLVITTHLSEEALQQLEELGVSGLDVCGNGLLLDPPRLMLRSSGATPRFRSEQRRNVYAGVTSLVARVFLVRSTFASPQDVREECHRRLENPGVLTAATVSRALKQMEEDLFLARVGSRRGEIRGMRPAEMLARLQREYVAPSVPRRLNGKLTGSGPIWARLREIADSHGVRMVATGRGSAAFHTAMSGPAMLQVYVTDLAPFERPGGVTPTLAFPNVELLETRDDRVYFDARRQELEVWSSPVQTYLELAEGGPRERDTAEELRRAILRGLEARA